MDYGKWTKYGKKWTYLWERPIFEHTMQRSRADFNGSQFELYFNAVSYEPINSIATRKELGRAFKKLFNADKYICTVSSGNSLRDFEGRFKNNVQFYCRISTMPGEETMSNMDEFIMEHTVPALFKGTDAKTGEVEYFNYSEIPGDYHKKRLIHQECEGTLDTGNKYKKKRTILGKFWTYA